MSWDYRVVRKRTERGDEIYSIHECFFDEEDRIWACTEDSIEPIAESPDELRDELIMMLQATTALNPVVDYDTIPDPQAIDPTAEPLDRINGGEECCIPLKGIMDEWLPRNNGLTCATCYHWAGMNGRKKGKCRARPVAVRDSEFALAQRYAYTYAQDWCVRWEGDVE